MLPYLEKLLKAPYDAELCCHLYWTADSYDLLYECMLPLVRIVLRREMFDHAEDEDYYADGFETLSYNLMYHKYDHDGEDPGSFNSFFYMAIRRAVVARYWADKYAMPFDHSESWRPQSQTLHPYDIENQMYLEQLPNHVTQLVLDRIRFTNRELNACLYFLNQLMTGGKIIYYYVKNDLGVQDPDFYLNYVLVLLRSTLHSMKLQGVYLMQGSERFVYDSE